MGDRLADEFNACHYVSNSPSEVLPKINSIKGWIDRISDYWQVMLHAAETWVMKAASLNRSRRNDCVRFLIFFSKGHNSKMGDNCNKKNKD